MAVQQVPQEFVASDGAKFGNQQDAERHDQVVIANKHFVESQVAWNLALARTQKTADGQPFELGVLQDYYFLVLGGWPRLLKTDFGVIWEVMFRVQFVNGETKVSVLHNRRNREDNNRDMEYPISQLYKDRRVAELALLAAKQKRLAELQVEVARAITTAVDVRSPLEQLATAYDVARQATMVIEATMLSMTKGLEEHPEGWDYPCFCDECRTADGEDFGDDKQPQA